jgi:hypothetical protein
MARLSRTQVVAATAVPVIIVLISLVLVAIRGQSSRPGEPPKTDGEGSGSSSESAEGGPRLAITPEEFDGMGKVLEGLGEGYLHQAIDEEQLRDPKALAKYAAVFLTCAEANPDVKTADLSRGLREFVSAGGTLYASDLRLDAVGEAFPELVDPASVTQGLRQEVLAEVVSPELRALVGARVPLHFELDGWRPAAFRGADVDVLIKGRFRTTAGVSIEAPLLVKFPFGKGTVIFTSFHHSRKNSEAETKLVDYLALKTVVAGLEFREVDTMAGDGLAAQATTAVGFDPAAKPLTLGYDHVKPGAIQFRLGFVGTGARMRLEVISPKGERITKPCESSVAIDIPNAISGRWEYRVVADEVPYSGFPTLLLVGAKGGPETERANPALYLPEGNVHFEEISLGNRGGGNSRTPRIAVSDPPNFDDMGSLLEKLGKGFQYAKVTMDDLLRSDALDDYDIFFLTCNAWPGEWSLSVQGKSARQGVLLGRIDEEKSDKACDTVRRFVERGGTLYASDMRIDILDVAFPDRSFPASGNDRVPPKMKDFRLNVAVIPAVMKMERQWLDVVAPSGHVDTVYDTLKKVDLSPALNAKLDTLVAAVEVSDLIKGELNRARSRPNEMVRALLDRFKLPFTDADVATIAKAMRDWESLIHQTLRARASTRTRDLMARSDQEMQRQRNRIMVRDEADIDQVVDAFVEDAGLRELLGVPKLSLNFNAPDWRPARFKGDVTVLLRGEYRTELNTRFETPLLVKFREGQGTVIFTSFHNEAQNNEQEETLLRYLVFTAVTAREEANADETMLKGGFSPAKQNQINHMAGNASITRAYTNPGSGPLRFALIFTGADARLRLTLVAPTGQRYTKEVESTLVVEASGAPPGEWSYTVEAVKVPYENFPFGVSIGKGDAPARP